MVSVGFQASVFVRLRNQPRAICFISVTLPSWRQHTSRLDFGLLGSCYPNLDCMRFYWKTLHSKWPNQSSTLDEFDTQW